MQTLVFLVLVMTMGLDTRTHCIKKETWGAFSKDDFDKMIEYSVNKEIKLLEAMIVQRRVVNLKKGTKIFVVDVGWTTTVIRLLNTERKIWVVTEAVSECN